MHEKLIKVLFYSYQLLRSIRYTVLYSFFGQVTHCKHEESCGTYFFRQIEEKGLFAGSKNGIVRFLHCW